MALELIYCNQFYKYFFKHFVDLIPLLVRGIHYLLSQYGVMET
nr:MAG TPA: hypothetical protein [Caudoviricetes sp.]